ncbi:MAG: ABC transporter ATP-binding protein [Clostridia bacterium]|nr:ABC transporter ATP-binding protein [Clostridia bacterium]
MNELNIGISHLKKSYLRPVLRDVNLTVDNSSYITIVGKSGSGKSTLLNILGLLESYDAGEYRFNGKLIRNYADYAKLRLENIGFIFQSYNLIPTLTCRENILMPTLYGKWRNKAGFDELVELLDIAPLLSQRVTALSGGEKQRVAIARSLILDPCLILADEPTGNLDVKNRDIIFDLLQHEHEKGRGIILITHDAEIAKRAEQVYALRDGELIVSRQ